MEILIWRFIFNFQIILRYLFIHFFKRYCDGECDYKVKTNDDLA